MIARYLRLELEDPSNPDGYLQAGRLVAGPAWQPRVNLQYGWSIEQVDDSRTVRSRGGQSYVDVQPKYRRLRFGFDFLERDEVFGHAYELERRLRNTSATTIGVAVHPGGTDTDLFL